MSDPISIISSNIPALSDPGSVIRAAAVIDGMYKHLWADVYDLGTLASLRAGLLARNALYEGNAIANIYRILASGHPAAREPKTATHILAILAALLQDVPAAFAAEGYAHLVYDAMDEGELIVPDYSELNAMRAQPLFVTLALNTMLDRPQRCDHDPHVSVGYINDLISMDSVDYITSAALQNLLKDSAFREVLYRGLGSADEHKLFKCLQLLKRCVGGGPGMLGGFSSHHATSPPWSLQQLLDFGAEQALVAACDTVATMVRQHSIERQLLGLLHTTLLDIFDLLSTADEPVGSSHNIKPGAGTATTAAAKGATAESAAAGSSSSSNVQWPAALVAAHMGLVLEVSKLVPVLVTCLCRMQPYAAQSAAAAAVAALGPQQCMSAWIAVLGAGDATDWLMIDHQAEGYKVINSLVQQNAQLALAALQAGATRTIFSALVEWAAYLPLPANSNAGSDLEPHSSISDLETEPIFDESQHGPSQHAVSQQQASNADCSKQQHDHSRRASSPFDEQNGKFVDPQVAAASAAALQLFSSLLQAAIAATCTDGRSCTDRQQGCHAEKASPAEHVAAAAETCTSTVAKLMPDMPEELPVLLLELWHVRLLQPVAARCLGQLQQLGVLTAESAVHADYPADNVSNMSALLPGGPGMPVVGGNGVQQQQPEQHTQQRGIADCSELVSRLVL